MRTTLTLLATMLAGGVALADNPAPRSPDFTYDRDARHVNRDLATSNAKNAFMPSALMLFAFDSSDIDPADEPELLSARDWLRDHPAHYLVIEAHTDKVGTYAYNAGLSARRGEAVRERLIALGANPDRLVVGIFGESLALANSPNDQANRRVVVRATDRSLKSITNRTLVNGIAVVWSYRPSRYVARQ